MSADCQRRSVSTIDFERVLVEFVTRRIAIHDSVNHLAYALVEFKPIFRPSNGGKSLKFTQVLNK